MRGTFRAAPQPARNAVTNPWIATGSGDRHRLGYLARSADLGVDKRGWLATLDLDETFEKARAYPTL